MNAGKDFELQWKSSMTKDLYYLRIKDSASSFGMDSDKTRFTPKNPYDCFVFYKRCLFPMELKSTQSTSISIQRNKDDKGKMIKLHQIKALTQANQFVGVFSGFIFNFRDTETYWLSIENFNSFLSESNKKSINENDVIKYKGIIVSRILKKVNYTYHVSDLLDKVLKDKNEV